MPHADDIARMRAEVDQAKEGLKELGGATFAFFQSLIDAGFCEDHALVLTNTWLTQLIQSAPLSGAVAEVFRRLEGED